MLSARQRPPPSTCPKRLLIEARWGSNRWHSLVNCNHGDSSSSRLRLTLLPTLLAKLLLLATACHLVANISRPAEVRAGGGAGMHRDATGGLSLAYEQAPTPSIRTRTRTRTPPHSPPHAAVAAVCPWLHQTKWARQ
jgi:hypothetical protein